MQLITLINITYGVMALGLTNQSLSNCRLTHPLQDWKAFFQSHEILRLRHSTPSLIQPFVPGYFDSRGPTVPLLLTWRQGDGMGSSCGLISEFHSRLRAIIKNIHAVFRKHALFIEWAQA